ncbi:uncharacterized protein LOC141657698 [Silene latifolia]|uniref:uncharacterized protein LOC141657698 n=1 Tax=Silene latifolia TaxID=37657 RepID=UPI003D776482
MKPSLDQVIDRMEELVDEEHWRAEDFEDYSKYYENESKMRSIWRKGVSLGKKMVFTSLVVSSTPFLLPPLVALSAIGFALSLPAGFVIATYACTDKLMNTLLPMPSKPLYLESGTMSSDEEEYKRYDDEVDKGYEEDDDEDVGVGVNELEEDKRKELEKRIELTKEDDRDIRDDRRLMPFPRDEQDTRMGVTEIVEEGGYEEDVAEYMDSEEQILDSTAIPAIVEGIREAEDDISLMEREGIEMPKDSLRAFLVEVGGRNEDNVEQVTEELVFVPPRDARDDDLKNKDLANIDQDELRNETTGLLERIRDEGCNELKQQTSSEKGKSNEIEQNGGIEIKDMRKERGDKKLSVIPEEVKPVAGVVGGEGQTVYEKNEKGNEAGISQAQLVIERTVVVNVKPSGDHTTTDVHQGTGLDEKIGTLILSEVDVMEVADESGFNEVPDQLVDSFNRGEDLAPEGPIDVSIDYHEIRIESMPKSQHDETGVDRESTADIDKDSVNEEKIWEQIHAIRTIIGYKTTPHASCVDELEALYVFTGIELPDSSKDAVDLGDVNEKLHFLMSVVGVK